MSFLRRYVPSTAATRAYAIVTLVQVVGVCSLESVMLVKGSLLRSFGSRNGGPTEQSALPVYLGIFLLANLFQLVLTIDAIANKNTIEIIGLDIFQLMLVVYGVVQIQEIQAAFTSAGINDPSVPILLDLIPIFMAVVFVIFMALTWPIFKEFGWQVFKHLGADRRIKRCYFAYQVFVSCLKFDYFILLAFSLQLVLLVLSQDDIERYLTLAAVPVTGLILIFGFFAIRRESKPMAVVFMVLMIIAIGYFSYKIFRIFQNPDGSYHLVQKSLVGFAGIALLFSAATLLASIRCFRNFGIGLKPHLSNSGTRISRVPRRHVRTASKADEAGYGGPETVPTLGRNYSVYELSHSDLSKNSHHRMSID